VAGRLDQRPPDLASVIFCRAAKVRAWALYSVSFAKGLVPQVDPCRFEDLREAQARNGTRVPKLRQSIGNIPKNIASAAGEMRRLLVSFSVDHGKSK